MSVPTAPTMEAVAPVVPEVPTMGGIQFDANGNVISTPMSVPTVPTMEAVAPVAPQINTIPETAPIIDSSSLNVTPVVTPEPEPEPTIPMVEPVVSTPIPEVVTPEPIIVTDYSKQYDPIMPTTMPEQPTKVDFKEIINAIRECSEKIEKYGYKIDVEEYDLSTLYQVVFKIEK